MVIDDTSAQGNAHGINTTAILVVGCRNTSECVSYLHLPRLLYARAYSLYRSRCSCVMLARRAF